MNAEGFADMTQASFHRTVPSFKVILMTVVLAAAGCSGMMSAPRTPQSIAGPSSSGSVTITQDFVTGLGAGTGTLEYQGRTYAFKLLGTVVQPLVVG